MAAPKTIDLESVKELAKKPMLTIPHRYLRLDQEPPITLSSLANPIPIIDMQKLVVGEDKDKQLHELHSICQEWGVFQVVNHGVSSLLVEKLKHEIEKFYKLPEEEKIVYKVRQGDVEGYGTLVFEENQKIDWADRFYMVTNPIQTRKGHLFPRLPSSLRETLETYIVELQKLAMLLLGLMAKTLNIDHSEMKDVFEDGLQSIRMTYYPSCPRPEAVIGLTPHSDASGITILLQGNGVDGLQVKKDGIWIPVNILPNSFIVNVGDALESMSFEKLAKLMGCKILLIGPIKTCDFIIEKQIFSNGVYKSIEHRVTVNPAKERISLAMFFNPKIESEVGPAHSITRANTNNPPIFKRVGMRKYVKDFFSRKLDGKSFLEQMRIPNRDHGTT